MEQKINPTGSNRDLIVDIARQVYPREFSLLEESDINEIFDSIHSGASRKKNEGLVGDLNLPSGDPNTLYNVANFAMYVISLVISYYFWKHPQPNTQNQQPHQDTDETVPDDIVGDMLKDDDFVKDIDEALVKKLLEKKSKFNAEIVKRIKKLK